MKKLFSTLFAMHAFLFLLLLTSCQSKRDYRTHLGPQQLNLLTSPHAGTIIEFDQDGTPLSLEIGQTFVKTYLAKETKGGMYTGGGSTYHIEIGTVGYPRTSTTGSIVSITARSENTYLSVNDPERKYTQEVHIGYSIFNIDFNNKLSSKVINGVTYTDVVLGVDPSRNDTLFWKKDIGILGWKMADQSFTTYRVF